MAKPRSVPEVLQTLDWVMEEGFERWLVHKEWTSSPSASKAPQAGYLQLVAVTESGDAPIHDEHFFIADGNQIAPYLRWLCILELIFKRWQKDAAAGWRHRDEAPYAGELSMPDLARRFEEFQPQDMTFANWSRQFSGALSNIPLGATWTQRSYTRDIGNGVYTAIDSSLRAICKKDGRKVIGLKDVLALRTNFPDDTFAVGIERLRNWISGSGHLAADNLSRLHAEHFIRNGSQAREDLLAKVVSRLTLDDDGQQPVVNVFVDDAWTGLRAFATEVCLEVKKDGEQRNPHERPLLVYLPLDRYDGETLDDSDGTPDHGLPSPHRAESNIDELYRAIAPEEVLQDPKAQDPLLTRVLRLQAELPKRRLIVIFGGVEVPPDPFGSIWNVLRNSEWSLFLKQVIQATFSSDPKAPNLRYRTRFLVLSNRQVDDLKPWTCLAEKLPPPPKGPEAEAVVAGREPKGRGTVPLEQRLRSYWTAEQFGPSLRNHGLSTVFKGPMKKAFRDLLKGGLPSESELSIGRACEDCGHDIGGNSWQRTGIAAWVAGAVPSKTRPDEFTKTRGLVCQWLAVSVSGLRLNTLHRLAERMRLESSDGSIERMQLAELDELSALLANTDWITEFAQRYRYVVALTADPDLLDVSDTFSHFELNGLVDSTSPSPRGDLHLDIRNERVREFLLADMLSTPAGVARFHRMNELLAQEALAQATTRMRHAGATSALDEIMVRRTVQAIFHGLLSLNSDDLGEHDPRPQAQPLSHDWRTLPANGYRRLVYLYEFLYRRLLEAPPAWRLGRVFSREELRLSLLAMFANPGWSKRVLSMLAFKEPEERTFEKFGAFAVQPVDGFGRALQPSALHLRGALGVDLFIALLRACLRSTKHPKFAQRAEIIGGQLAIHRSFRPGTGTEFRRMQTFKKLQIDALQASDSLPRAMALLKAELQTVGVNLTWLSEKWFTTRCEQQGNWLSQTYLSSCVKKTIEDICKHDHRELAHISDLVFRYGEHFATNADWKDERTAAELSIPRYAQAYALFYIADRVRSAAATLDDSTVEWPSVSARATRYFVRVALKLAKITAYAATKRPQPEAEQMAASALQFYHHAMSRIDVYTRHLAGYPTEEIQGLMLMAAAARVRSSIAKSFAKLQEKEDPTVVELLELSNTYLADAWPKLVALGLPRALSRRFFLERFKTHAKLSSSPLDERKKPHVREMKKRDRATLEGLAQGSTYWGRLIEKLGPAT